MNVLAQEFGPSHVHGRFSLVLFSAFTRRDDFIQEGVGSVNAEAQIDFMLTEIGRL
jgi:hypothetical protein